MVDYILCSQNLYPLLQTIPPKHSFTVSIMWVIARPSPPAASAGNPLRIMAIPVEVAGCCRRAIAGGSRQIQGHSWVCR